jgi:hypothetical protein
MGLRKLGLFNVSVAIWSATSNNTYSVIVISFSAGPTRAQ